jgi:hypothetical protein
LFNGFSTDEKGTGSGNPWIGHPMNASNNSNEINGDTNGDGAGTEVHRSTITAVDTIWKSYIRKVVDTVNDLDNVVFEICNELDSGSMEWQQAMVTYLKEYELTKPKQHLVGITVNYPGGTNTELLSSNADWISPNSTGGMTQLRRQRQERRSLSLIPIIYSEREEIGLGHGKRLPVE